MRPFPILTWWVSRIIFRILSFTLLTVLSGCSTLSPSLPLSTSLDQYPPLIIPDGPNIDPASDEYTVADVDVFALNDQMKRILDESVIHIDNPKQRLDALLKVIYDRGLYRITADRHRTKTAIETFESGTGNCLSFSNTFLAMARYVHLNARFQDVQTVPNWGQFGKIITISRHISVAVTINDHSEYEIDFYYRSGFSNLKERDKILNQNRLYDPKEKRSVNKISDYQAIAQYYNNIGSEHLAEGNLRDAFRYFVKALKEDPGIGFVWSNLGAVYRQNRQVKAAEMAYKQAISINPYEFTAMSNLARLYTFEGRIEEANLIKRKVQFFRNKNPYNHYAMGKKAFDNGQFEASVKHFKRAINRKKDDHQFHFALARAYLKIGNYKKAQKSIENARAFAPDETTRNYYSQKWEVLSQDLNNAD